MAPKTPPPKPPATLETPIFVRSTSGHSYDATLAASRKAVMEDLHRIPIAKIDDMLTATFPQSNGDINTQGRWKAFDLEPSKQKGTEDSVYNRGLLDTFSQIMNAAKSLVSNMPVAVALKVSGSKTPQSDRTNTSRPDGYFHLQSSTIPLQNYRALKLGANQTHWGDIVCPMEFKKIDDKINRYDDMWKVVWSMHEIMRSDPLRRFAHGITIEGTTLRFWISHRAYLVASTPIDINSNCIDLVRIFLGIALSTMSQLGYDTTMGRVSSRDDSDKYCYDITVRDHSGKERIFRTKDEISTYGADAVRGRGTRERQLFALKDTWVNMDRPREGDTLRGLRQRLAQKNEIDALKHFLTEVTCGDVYEGDAPDHTGDHIQNGKLFTVDSILETRVATDGVGTVTDIHPVRSGSKRPASTMGNVPNIEVSSAEGTLRIGQFIHRDVSCSNILLFRAPGQRARGLLVDLEYAKDIDIKTAPHEFRTGTRDFMASEVRESKYLFRNPTGRKLSDIKKPPPFQHNRLHDLESTWWIGLWTTYVFAPIVPSEEDVIHFQQLFPPPHVSAPRTSPLALSLIHGDTMADFAPQQNNLFLRLLWEWRYDLYIVLYKTRKSWS
ncbi:hypothetical protein BS47DRAFT_1362840 [Hydnum rufescens UP504]|uniref:Fungal-type protein kinase domain-containing protein n=1 Tax=Hydnum rufescens UP504 TaxID=1448309 RepID=A0A9P6AVW7_9AGAM|nr:hypothetical protein BS47DRAFT_1362840 [Hydnum rufescens UP504]